MGDMFFIMFIPDIKVADSSHELKYLISHCQYTRKSGLLSILLSGAIESGGVLISHTPFQLCFSYAALDT